MPVRPAVWRVLAVCLALLVPSGCKHPRLDGFEPAAARPRDTVRILGADLEGAQVVWDSGSDASRVIPGGFPGATLFQVPRDAAAGAHKVHLRSGWLGSAALSFNVTKGGELPRYGAPRLDHVTLAAASFPGPGRIVPVLYVQGGNIDVGARVLVNGTEVASVAHRSLRNDLLGLDDLGRPLYHYDARIALPGEQALGTVLNVVVENEDGLQSDCTPPEDGVDPCTYVLPGTPDALDSDGDHLLDSWEAGAYTAPDGTNLDLRTFGVDPHRRDLLVELDVMEGVVPPKTGSLHLLRDMFAAAPMLNPGETPGINLYIDPAGSVPCSEFLCLDRCEGGISAKLFDAEYYHARFTCTRRKTFHYGIWGYRHPADWSGEGGDGATASAVFVVTLAGMSDFPGAPGSVHSIRSEAATLAHEIGHNLEQRHAGVIGPRCGPFGCPQECNQETGSCSGCDRCASPDCSASCFLNYLPTYSSVMSYAWQLRSAKLDDWRCRHPVCSALYYGDHALFEGQGRPTIGSPAVPVIDHTVDYSEGMGVTLDESSLDERAGLCGRAIDWNCDQVVESPVQQELNKNRCCTDRVSDYPNWQKLNFFGPTNGGLCPQQRVAANAAPPRLGCEAAEDGRRARLVLDTLELGPRRDLWKAAANSIASRGLCAVPFPELAVTERKRPRSPGSAPDTSPPPPLPACVAPALVIYYDPGPFSGVAPVTAWDGQRLELSFGAGRTLLADIRRPDRPLRLHVGEPVRVVYQARRDPGASQELLLLQSADDVFASLATTGPEPLSFTIPGLGLTVGQEKAQDRTALEVSVTGHGGAGFTLEPGVPHTLGPLTLLVTVSTHASPERGAGEGSAYWLRLLAWRTGP